MLEELASVAVNSNVITNIAQVKGQLKLWCSFKVYDQNLNYISLESCFYSLNMQDTYLSLNSPVSKDTDIEDLVSKMVSSLYSVIMTLGLLQSSGIQLIFIDCLPIIRCPKGNAAEMVSKKLESKLRDWWMNSKTTNVRDAATSGGRPGFLMIQLANSSHYYTRQVARLDINDKSFLDIFYNAPRCTQYVFK